MKRLVLLISIFLPGISLAIDVQTFRSDYLDITLLDHQLIGLKANGKAYRLAIQAGRIVEIETELARIQTRPDDILSDGEVVEGQGLITKAWLGGATDRYDHGVLANYIEASRIYALDADHKVHHRELQSHQVFEDLSPRLADLDGDGQDELIVIRTDVNTGAGLASYGLNNGLLTLEAASDTIGLSHRWMNIVGIADFNGDGKIEIAAVITPHIGGTLTLFQQQGKKLIPIFEQYGFSNHQNGSREMGMSAALDMNGDRVMDMAVPDQRRQDLILLTTRGNQFKALGKIKNAYPISSGIYLTNMDVDENPELVYLLSNGMLMVVNF